ncbi:MAG: sigma-70 family RNA polymerase sigma factor [Ferruginibacter sp.]
MTEQELIKGCIDKRRDYQKLLFDRYSGKMMSVCLRYVNDEHRAQDILQEGFIKVFGYIHQYRFDGSFEGWMRRVFVTVAARQLNKEKILFTDVDLSNDAYTSIDPSVVSKLSEDEIHLMIRSMPEGYRTVFNLAVIEGYSHEEIAAMLDIQPTTSRGQLLKARKYLQALILKKYNSVKI